jgi:hypothetical protein
VILIDAYFLIFISCQSGIGVFPNLVIP